MESLFLGFLGMTVGAAFIMILLIAFLVMGAVTAELVMWLAGNRK